MPINLQEWLEAAVDAAFYAGDIIVQVGASLSSVEADVKTKSNDGDFVTVADRSAQRAICSILRGRFPHLKIVGEESNCGDSSSEPSPTLHTMGIDTVTPPIATMISDNGSIQASASSRDICSRSLLLAQAILQEEKETAEPLSAHVLRVPCDINLSNKDCVVFVDPLDGTFNFVRKCFYGVGVSIGLAYKGEAIAGIMFYPFFSKDLLKKHDFPEDFNVYMGTGATMHPFHACITELRKDNVPMDLFYGARYGGYCNSNLIGCLETLLTKRLHCISESKPFSEHYFQVQNMPIEALEPLTQWIDQMVNETHIKLKATGGLQTFYGALCKFREFLLGIGGCLGVIYINGFLKPWDICAFMGIAHSLQIDVYTKEPRPPTLSKTQVPSYMLRKGYAFKPNRKDNIPFLIAIHKDLLDSQEFARIALEIAISLN